MEDYRSVIHIFARASEGDVWEEHRSLDDLHEIVPNLEVGDLYEDIVENLRDHLQSIPGVNFTMYQVDEFGYQMGIDDEEPQQHDDDIHIDMEVSTPQPPVIPELVFNIQGTQIKITFGPLTLVEDESEEEEESEYESGMETEGGRRRKTRKTRSQTKRFCKCIKAVRKTIKARKGSTKEKAAIATCVKSVLHSRKRTLKRFKCGRKARVTTQRMRR